MSDRKRIYLCLAHMSEAGLEQKYIKEAFDTNWVVPLGPNVNGFEKDLEDFVNQNDNENEKLTKRVVALSSGTAAVHLGLLAAGVKAGDEVIVQSFTFCASTHPITYLGATPILIDSEPDTWNIDPVLMEEAIKDRIAKTGKKPAAIVPVALYGMPYKADKIMEIANRYGIPVVEDAAEGFGSRFNGQMLGTFGKYGVLSFNGNKMITTSGGGALITANEDEWREIMMYATQYRESYPYYQHEKIGYNYRMSNICAGIGRGQMTVVNDHLAHHRHVQKMYEELLAGVPGVHVHSQPSLTPVPSPTGEGSVPVYDSNYWLCTITIDENVKVKGQEDAYKTIVTGAVGGAAGVIHAAESAHTDCEPNANVEAMRVALDKAQIEARPVWKPMHKQPVYCRGNVKIEKLKNESFIC
ncbi:MAG: aminotransferase class I/II-fold pyridoxal phosphate-dependent enzyme, partial [Clostridium lundense]|nr:aminotransferase class I/II-fold pyridoxal phosphate-dependent enzyme [Clostridium lundense]